MQENQENTVNTPDSEEPERKTPIHVRICTWIGELACVVGAYFSYLMTGGGLYGILFGISMWFIISLGSTGIVLFSTTSKSEREDMISCGYVNDSMIHKWIIHNADFVMLIRFIAAGIIWYMSRAYGL